MQVYEAWASQKAAGLYDTAAGRHIAVTYRWTGALDVAIHHQDVSNHVRARGRVYKSSAPD
jgi:hypothetical protein